MTCNKCDKEYIGETSRDLNGYMNKHEIIYKTAQIHKLLTATRLITILI